MIKINFTKMQGLGNDFIIFDEDEFAKVNGKKADFVAKVCDRNFSIGADGVIVVQKSVPNADIGWLFFNSDGTFAQMCGNGMRCFARYVFENNILGENKKQFTVSTQAGIIEPKIVDENTVCVNMGKPILSCEKIPFKGKQHLMFPIEAGVRKFNINAVSMGNPHCVIFVDENENTKEFACDYGPLIEKNALFPEKTNVEFVKILNRNEIVLDVWERGCGITLACGTGACASVVSGVLNGLLDNKAVKVHLPGGDLSISYDGSKENPDCSVFMTGVAEKSFTGTIEI